MTANLSINEQVTLSEAQRQIKQLRQQLNEAKNISIIPSSLSSCGLCNNAMAKLAEFEQKIKSLSEENEALRQKVRQQDSYVTHIGANERSANKESIHSSFSQFGLSSDSQASYSENAAGIRISGKMKSMLDELDNISSAGGIGRTNYVSGLGNKQDSESVFHQNPTSSIAGLGNSNVNNNQIPMRKPVSTAPSRPTSSSAPSPKSIQNVAISTSIHDNVISVSNMQHNTYSNDVEDKKQGIAFNGSNLNTVSSLPNQFQPSQMANSSSNVAATIHYSSKSTIKPPNEGNAPSSLSGLNSGVDRTQISITQPAQSLLASKIQEMRSSKEVDSKFCKKHGLEDCVLCKMFGNEGNNSPVRTYGSTNYGESNFNRSNTHLEASASPFVTNTNWSQPRPNGNSYSSNSNATQFHSNASFQNVSALTSSGTYSASNSYASMNNITQESGNSQHRFQQLPIQTSYSSNPFGNEVQNDDEDDDDDNDDDNDIQIPSGGSLSKNLMALKLAADGSICQTHGLVDCLLCNMQSSHNKASSGGGMNKLGSSLNSSNGSITNSNMAMILPPLLSQDVGVMFSPLNMNGNHGGFVSTLDSAEMKQKQYGFGTTTSSTKSFVSSQVLQNQGAQMLNQSIKSNKVKEIKAISAIRSHQNQQMNTSPYIDSMASATYGDHMNNNNTYQYVPIGNQLHPRTSSSPLPFNHTNNIPPLIQNHDNDYLGNEDEDDDILEDHEFNFEDNGGTFYHDNADATNPSEKKKVKKKKKKVKKAATINTAAALAYLPASGNISHQQPPYGNSQVTSYLRPSSTQRPKNVNSNNLSNPVGTPSEAHKTPAKERKKVPKVIRQDA